MHARRFYANTQSHSWNLASTSPAGQHVDHSPVQIVRDGLNETAHKSYVQFCRGRGIQPLSFGDWSRLVDKVSTHEAAAGEARAFKAFHGYLPSENPLHRLELQDHITVKSRGLRQEQCVDGKRLQITSGMRRTLPARKAE